VPNHHDIACQSTLRVSACIAVPAAYRCVRRSLVREGFETFSEVVGALEPMDVVTMIARCETQTGVARLCFQRGDSKGWISETGASGQTFVVLAADQNSPPATESTDDTPRVSTLAFPKRSIWGNTSDATVAERQATLREWLETLLVSRTDDVDLMEWMGMTVPVARVVWGGSELRKEQSKEYTVYKLDAFGAQGQHTNVEKRFSEFCALRDTCIAKDRPGTAAVSTARYVCAVTAARGGLNSVLCTRALRGQPVVKQRNTSATPVRGVEMTSVATESEKTLLGMTKFTVFVIICVPRGRREQKRQRARERGPAYSPMA
jgi:hypothetical protein